jgi:hypothetical protein
VDIAVTNPVFTVEGSADDTDPSNGPGRSYGPVNQANGSCTDGGSQATSACFNEKHVSADVIAQVGRRSASTAKANAKAVARSTLDISYDFWDRLWLLLFRIRPKLKMDIVISMNVNLNDGPASASFAVFIGGGPPGAPAPSWSGSYSFVKDQTAPGQLIATRQDGRQITETNPGRITDYPDTKVELPPGRYHLTFEATSAASADGTVTVSNDSRLSLSEA